MATDYDLVVIGGGAAGIAAALTGVQKGANTLLVEEGRIGGDCTFTGCVPSKTLLAAAARRDPFPEAMARVRAAVERIAATESTEVFRRAGVNVLHGRASLRTPTAIDVDGRTISARRFVLATGTRPALPPIEGLESTAPLTSDDVFSIERLPSSLAVLGGGPSGCELAQAFARLGSHVTIIEALKHLLPGEEPEASEVIAQALATDGIEVRTGALVTKAEQLNGHARLHLEDGEPVEAERVLVATGRRPTTAELGLEAAGVITDAHGFIEVDEHLKTSAPGIYAAGDITGRMPLTHVADEMGRLAAGNALRRRSSKLNLDAVPQVTYTDPEVAHVGVRERDVVEGGGRVAYLPMSSFDRAILEGREEGFVKLIAGPRRILGNTGGGRVLGATIVCPRAGELIHEPTLAIRTGMFTGRLAQTVHAYPSWSTAIREAAAQFFMRYKDREARPAGGD